MLLFNFVFMKALFKHALLIIAGTLLCLFHSCKREKQPIKWAVYGPYYMGDLANYVCFKPGTYWIYKNPATNERDTVRCVLGEKYMDTVVSPNYGIKVVKETFWTGFTFSKDGYDGDFTDFRFIEWRKPAEPFEYKVDFSKTKTGKGGGTLSTLFYPFDKSKNPTNIEPGFQFTTLLSKDTAVNIYGRFFDTVQVFKYNSDVIWYDFPSLYYWAKGYGIVYRKDINSGEEWFLESEYIIQ